MKNKFYIVSILFIFIFASCATFNRLNRVKAMKKVTQSALDYAMRHDGKLPTTKELAIFFKKDIANFRYKVVLTGKLDQHKKRVSGWPKVLIAEKCGGSYGEWSFGYVDGMCSVLTLEKYEKMENINATEQIKKSLKSQN